jgi:hypothetical protein
MKYRINAPASLHPAHKENMNRLSGEILDITKVAVVGSVGMGLAGTAAGLKK